MNREYNKITKGPLLFLHLNLLDAVFCRVREGVDLPATGAEGFTLETGLLFSNAVDSSEDGPPQQDVDPGVQDLVPGGHSDTGHHQLAVVVGFVIVQSASVGEGG